MKHKIFSTNKADILVVDLPKNAGWIKITKNILYYAFYQKRKKHNESILIPHGNWQPLTFDEETAEKLIRWLPHSCSPEVKCWEDVTMPNAFPPFDTALESLKSLIDKEVFSENPYGDEPEMEEKGAIEDDYNNWKKKAAKWLKAEENTYHNPFYFFKLK